MLWICPPHSSALHVGLLDEPLAARASESADSPAVEQPTDATDAERDREHRQRSDDRDDRRADDGATHQPEKAAGPRLGGGHAKHAFAVVALVKIALVDRAGCRRRARRFGARGRRLARVAIDPEQLGERGFVIVEHGAPRCDFFGL